MTSPPRQQGNIALISNLLDGRRTQAKSMNLQHNCRASPITSFGTLWTCSQFGKRRLKTKAASLSLPMPLAGGLNSVVSISGSTASTASSSPPSLIQSSSSPSGKLTIDPRASGEDVTVVRLQNLNHSLDMPVTRDTSFV